MDNTTTQNNLLLVENNKSTSLTLYLSLHQDKMDLNETISNYSIENTYTSINDFSANATIENQTTQQQQKQVQLLFHGILLIVIGVIGVIGNISGIVHFCNMKRPLKFHWLMMTLFVFDTIFVLSAIVMFALPTLSEEYKANAHLYIGPKTLFFIQMAMTGSLYCQIGFTIERYLVVCHPFYIVAKEWSVKRYIIPLVTFSIFYNLPKFFELDTFVCDSELFHKQHENITAPHSWTRNATLYAPTEMRRNHYYQQVYLTGMNIVFMLIGPFLVLIVLNSLTLMNLGGYAITQRRDSAFFKYGAEPEKLSKLQPTGQDASGSKSAREVILVKISLAIVFISILMHSVKWVPTIYELVDEEGYQSSVYMVGSWITSWEYVSHFLLVVDASIRFYIYLIPRSKALNKVRRHLSGSFKFNGSFSNKKSSKPHQCSYTLGTFSTDVTSQDSTIIKPMLPNNDNL